MTVRWGIVCAGKICHDFVNAVNSYPNKGDQVIAAIAARNKERATEFAKLHKIPKVYDSYEALAASADIDIAYIGALNPDHYALSKLFLEHGKHVLCEKPLCLNFKQAQSIIKLAEKKKLFFMEGVWSRFAPSYVALEKDIKDGKLGEVKFVEVNLGVPMANVDRISKKELGGSVVLDIGVYVLQLSQFVFKDEPLEENFNFSTALTREGGKTEYFPLHESPLPYNFDNSAGLVYETLEVVRCIKNGLIESPRMSHKESLTLAKLEDEVRRQIGVHFDADDQDYP
nr:trans-1,2-dihydrobenzene-1,2-diol dehydrogenase-like isoform X2 [Plodia interpunctella]